MMGEGGDTPLTLEEARLLAEDLRHVLHERDLLSLEAARIAGVLAAVDYGDAAGSVSTIDWIRHEYHLGYMGAADLVAAGLEIDSLPEAVAAVEEGEIGFQHLVHLARTRRAVAGKGLDTPRLLEAAKEVSVGRFWHLCQEARHAADAKEWQKSRRPWLKSGRCRSTGVKTAR